MARFEMPALDELLDKFARQTRARVFAEFMAGRTGWDRDAWTEEHVRIAIFNQMDKPDPDPLDLAAFAAFLWHKKGRPDA